MNIPAPEVTVPELLQSRRGLDLRERTFKWALLASMGVALAVLGILITQVAIEGWPRLNLDLLRRYPSSLPQLAGAQSAIFGTLWVVGTAAAMAVPIGIAAAIYLEEFADKTRWYNRLLELNIQNLAGVPSIIYGILGLGVFVRGFFGLGFTVLAAAMTLALLVLPIVIIAARESLRAVPPSIREASLALGATPWQTVWKQTLPSAVPGIATGTILALSRAIGEAAPLVVLGGLTFITFNPTGLDSAFTVLPIQIFNYIQRPQDEYRVVAAAMIIVLLAMLLLMNSIAIYVRNRFRRDW